MIIYVVYHETTHAIIEAFVNPQLADEYASVDPCLKIKKIHLDVTVDIKRER